MQRLETGTFGIVGLLGLCASLAAACADEPGSGQGVTYGAADTEDSGDGDGDGQGTEAGEGNGDGDGDGNAIVHCDPWAQDCPEGEKCVPGTWDVEGGDFTFDKCVPVLGEGEVGESCVWDGSYASTDDCGADSYCWNATWIEEQQALVGTCMAFCQGNADEPECASGSFCAMWENGVFNVCVELCDPIAQDCDTTAHDDVSCYWFGDTFGCAQTELHIPLGEPCTYINDCDKGGVCVPAESLPSCAGDACCTALCDVEDPEACGGQPGTQCVGVFDPGNVPHGFPDAGLCTLPV